MRPDDDHADLPDPAALLASLMSLMTGFARVRCPRQVVMIERQLAYLGNYPEHLMPPILKAAAKRLRGEWQRVLFELPRKDDPPAVAPGTRPVSRLH